MILLLFKRTLTSDTHLHKHTRQESYTQSLFCLPSAHSAQHSFGLPPPNGSLRLHKKGRNASFPPAASVWEDFYGSLELDFLCNLYSCVIFSNPIESVASWFSVRAREEMEARSWCVWVRVVMKQLEAETNPPVHLSPSTPTCCLPSIPLYSLLTLSLACQMVLEWILKSWLHWTSITSKLLKTTLTKL